jgi:hypothetical protein
VATADKESGGGDEQEGERIKTTRMLITGGIGAALRGALPAKKNTVAVSSQKGICLGNHILFWISFKPRSLTRHAEELTAQLRETFSLSNFLGCAYG